MIPDGIYYIVMADLVGSSGYTTKMGNDAGIARSEEFKRAVMQACEHALFAWPGHTGVFVKTVGDAVLLVFKHFPDIVQWYLEFDGVLFYTPTRTEPMKARIWVHVGEVRFEEGDFSGSAVNELCKIEKKAKDAIEAGCLVLSHLANQIAKPALFPKHCALKYRMSMKLEGHSSVKLYQVVKADLPFLISKQTRQRRANEDITQ